MNSLSKLIIINYLDATHKTYLDHVACRRDIGIYDYQHKKTKLRIMFRPSEMKGAELSAKSFETILSEVRAHPGHQCTCVCVCVCVF